MVWVLKSNASAPFLISKGYQKNNREKIILTLNLKKGRFSSTFVKIPVIYVYARIYKNNPKIHVFSKKMKGVVTFACISRLKGANFSWSNSWIVPFYIQLFKSKKNSKELISTNDITLSLSLLHNCILLLF